MIWWILLIWFVGFVVVMIGAWFTDTDCPFVDIVVAVAAWPLAIVWTVVLIPLGPVGFWLERRWRNRRAVRRVRGDE